MQTCQGAGTFKGEFFYLWELPRSAAHCDWARKKLLISRSSKTPIFAFLLCISAFLFLHFYYYFCYSE